MSQWRAYCAPTGGYSLGLPWLQLRRVALSQGFFLSPCEYDGQKQYRMMEEIVDYHVQQFRACGREENARAAAVAAARDIARYAPMLKDSAFEEEREWRLVSFSRPINDTSVKFRAGETTVLPYLEFHLETAEHPFRPNARAREKAVIIRAGPSANDGAASYVTQALKYKYFNGGVLHSVSQIPYRGT